MEEQGCLVKLGVQIPLSHPRVNNGSISSDNFGPSPKRESQDTCVKYVLYFGQIGGR